MSKLTPLGWKQLEERRTSLRKQIKAKEETLKVKSSQLFAAPQIDNKLDLAMNYVKSATSSYDGFMTGFKLFKSIRTLFNKSKIKR